MIDATLINAGIPSVFVEAHALGLGGVEMPTATASEATTLRPHTPKLPFVSAPTPYRTTNGKAVKAEAVDLVARTMSMGKAHHAMTGAGAVAIAVAAARVFAGMCK